MVRRAFVVIRWTPILALMVVLVVTWILLPLVWQDFRNEWQEAA